MGKQNSRDRPLRESREERKRREREREIPEEGSRKPGRAAGGVHGHLRLLFRLRELLHNFLRPLDNLRSQQGEDRGRREFLARLLRVLLVPRLLQVLHLLPVLPVEDEHKAGVQPQGRALWRLLHALLVPRLRPLPGGEGAQAEGRDAGQPCPVARADRGPTPPNHDSTAATAASHGCASSASGAPKTRLLQDVTWRASFSCFLFKLL